MKAAKKGVSFGAFVVAKVSRKNYFNLKNEFMKDYSKRAVVLIEVVVEFVFGEIFSFMLGGLLMVL